MKIVDSLRMKLASIFPFLLLLVAEAGFGVAFIFGGIGYAYKSLIYIIPLIMVAIIIYFSRGRRQAIKIGMAAKLSKISFSNLILMNIFLYIVSAILLVSFPTRTWVYFAVVSIIAGLIFVQVMCRRHLWTDYLIIFEIILLSLDLIWGVSLKYPLFFGLTDVPGHLLDIQIVVQTGHLNSIEISYLNYPLFHILNAAVVQVTGLSLERGLFVFGGISWQVGILFAYLIFNKISNSKRFSLMAYLLFALSSEVIYYGSYAITRSLAFVMFLCLLYLILDRPNIKYVVLSLISLTVLILTHHVTVLFVIPILIIIYIFQKIFDRDILDKSKIQGIAIQLLTIGFFFYLLYVAYPFTIPAMQQMFASLTSGNLAASITSPSALTSIYYSFVVLFCFLGIYKVFNDTKLSKKRNGFICIAFPSLIFLLLYVPGPIDLLPINQTALLYRLPLLVSPFIICMIAYGVDMFANVERTVSQHVFKRYITVPVLTITLVVIMIFFSTISGSNAYDNNYILRGSKTGSDYFTNSELTSFSFVEYNCYHNLSLYGDNETMRNTFSLEDFRSMETITGEDINYIEEGYLIFRFGELQRTGGLDFKTYRYYADQLNSQAGILRILLAKNLVYSNRDVQVYWLNTQ